MSPVAVGSFLQTLLVGFASALLAACGGRVASGEPAGSDAAPPTVDADASNVGTPARDAADAPTSSDASIDRTLVDGAVAGDATTSVDGAPSTAKDGSEDTSGDSSTPNVDAGDDGTSCPRAICPNALATGFGNTWFLTVNATHVFFTFTGADAGGGVAAVALDGGAPVTLVASPEYEGAYDIAVDDASVYWTNFEGALDGVMKVPIGGGDASLLVAGVTYPRDLAVNATDVYWTNAASSGDGGSIMLTSNSGTGTPITIASTADPWGIALDSTSIYWTSGDFNEGTVMKVSLDGGTPVTLASGQQSPDGIVVDATSVYWLSGGSLDGGGSVLRMPLDGGAPSVVVENRPGLWAFTIDATNIYWLTLVPPPATGTIEKAPLDGGPSTMLATGLTAAWDIAVDDRSVYWTNAGSVMVLTPK